MYFLDNPVMQRELLVNLRMGRSFFFLLLYQVLLGAMVLIAWPHPEAGKIDLTTDSADAQSTKQLINLFFQGQFVLASLMVPSFAAGTITGEKERHTYEMLLASPLRPSAIVLGKLVASLAHLAILIFASLPIVMLCLPLGGTQFFELIAAYFALMVSICTFGMISVACSAYFARTSASLVVSYLLILPLSLLGAFLWSMMSEAEYSSLRLFLIWAVLPPAAAAVFLILAYCIRPTSVRKARTWSTWSGKQKQRWDWSSSATSFLIACLLPRNATTCFPTTPTRCTRRKSAARSSLKERSCCAG
jgi:ABC-type transport system involved in multi-copper enzyme maturation permease subunit